MSEDRGHSFIGASSASRWFACPGSVELCKLSPAQPQNKHAARGTKAHEILEDCLGTDLDPYSYINQSYFGGTVDQEDADAVQDTIDWLNLHIADLTQIYGGVRVLKEVGFDLSNLHPDLWGTSDIVIYTEDFSYLGVFDYKHGTKLVKAEENLQLQYYTLGAINFLGRPRIPLFGWGGVFQHVEVGIIQPRVNRKDNSPRVWELNREQMDCFAEELRERAKATVGSTEYSVGNHCYWCTGKALCPQMYNKKIEKVKQDFKPIDKE